MAEELNFRQQRSADARKKRASLGKKAKAHGKKTFRVRSKNDTKKDAKSAVKPKTTVAKAPRQLRVPEPNVSRMGRVKNAILMKYGLREKTKGHNFNVRRQAKKWKAMHESDEVKKAKKAAAKGKKAPKKVVKKKARKEATAKRVKEEEAVRAKNAAKGNLDRKPDKAKMLKRVADRRAKALAKVGKKITKKEKKPFVFKKADGTVKKFSDKKTRLAAIAMRERLRQRHPKVRSTYPTMDIMVPDRTVRKQNKVCKLREGLKPGTVCIVLAGVNKGKRVIFLKQLTSGLCLINGPLALNRVPLRRIAQCFLLATSTRIHLPTLPIGHMDDPYFARRKLDTITKKDSDLFEKKKEYYHVSKLRKRDQKRVDFFIMKFINSRKDKKTLRAYLATKFLLGNHDYPHAMKF